MAKKKHLIVGCGSAALSALETIRGLDKEDEIKVVAAEKHRPYSPTALPYLLSGRIKESNLWMRPDSYFQKLGVTFEPGKEVAEVSPQEKAVRFTDGSVEHYDRLLLATGATPVRPPIRGLDGANYLGFRTLDDCRELAQRMETARNATILGAGLVGMEVAMGLIEKGYNVNVVARGRVLRVYFDPEAEAMIREIFLQHGARLITGHEIAEVRNDGSGIEIDLIGGEPLRTQVLITATGVQPRTGFLEGSGINTNDGVLVGRDMQTSAADVYAAGDVAEALDFFTGQPGLNPIIPSAVSQGRVAGTAMVGEGSAYEGSIPMNVFNFFGNFAFSVGLATVTNSVSSGNGAAARPEYEIVKSVDAAREQLKKMVFASDHLVGVMLMNVPADPGIFQYLIANRIDLGKHKQLLFERPKDIGRALMLDNEKRQTRIL